MRDVVCVFVAFICIFSFFAFTVRASDDSHHYYEFMMDGLEFDILEGDEPERPIEGEAVDMFDYEKITAPQNEFYERLLSFLDERLPLGASGEEIEIPPLIHELIDESDGLGFGAMSIVTQANYPYTGGSFMAVNTNYGTGLICIPEPYKVNTFGFIKNSNRVVNLTNSTISCYFILGGTTYNARFQRYGEFEYAYVSGSTTTWRAVTVNGLTDSNVQFLDETGERGIQRPYITLTDKLLILLVVVEVFIHLLQLVRRR